MYFLGPLGGRRPYFAVPSDLEGVYIYIFILYIYNINYVMLNFCFLIRSISIPVCSHDSGLSLRFLARQGPAMSMGKNNGGGYSSGPYGGAGYGGGGYGGGAANPGR